MSWVVKIGGGLHDSPRLKKTVRRLNDFDSPALVVPGGGPFADQVRASQRRWKFDDCCAHAMALLGMRQYGYLLAALGGFETTGQAAVPPADGAPRVWLPDETALAGRLAASWDVTSDSIAAWLAREVGADWLVLVKPAPSASLKAPLKLVDAAFADSAKAGGLRCALVGVEQWLARDFSCAAHRFALD